MKKFIFRLQTVLDHALRLEEERLQELARLQSLLYLKQEEILRAQDACRKMRATIGEHQRGLFDAATLQHIRLHLEALQAEVVVREEERSALEAQIAAQMQQVMEARQKRQALEKLREKQWDAYRLASERQDLQNMEDVMLPRHAARLAEAQAAQASALLIP
jgi:flagellar FliJ protein